MLTGGHATNIVTLGHLVTLFTWQVIHVSCDIPIVNTKKGQVRGFTEEVNGTTLHVFYGIPFAAPPLGQLRYKPPVENEPWEGVLDGTKLPNSCFQGEDKYFGNFSGAQMWNPNTPVSEDCLYLNVWVPKKYPPYKDKAVIVWVYGGGFYSGSSTLDIYKASYLAAENDVIVVSMQYRVGSLGFLALNTPEAPGNAGLWDQKMALEWVSQNIDIFGGSPRNVTLMGESAGAVSVGAFLLCEKCSGLFHRAILQSGSPEAKWGILPKEAVAKRSELFAQNVGCNKQADHEYIIKCLRDLPYTEYTVSQETIWDSSFIPFIFVPIVDRDFLRQDPAQLLRTENFNKVPILIGSNENEGNYFIIYHYNNSCLKSEPTINKPVYSHFMKNRIFKYYPYEPIELNEFGQEAIMFQYKDWLNPENQTAMSVSMDRAVSDFHFVCPVNYLAKTYAKANLPVYYYWFSQRWSANPWPEWMGVLHADEIWFTFGHPFNSSYIFTEGEKQLSRTMMAYWTNFAKTGDPNQGTGDITLHDWPLFKPNEQLFINLSVASLASGHPWGQGPRTQQCAFWDEYFPKLLSETSNISDVEKEWKRQFHEWKTHYIVDWKTQFDNFLSSYQRRMGSCGGRP